jgi:membrane protein YdbS with pleckstrin-like domain
MSQNPPTGPTPPAAVSGDDVHRPAGDTEEVYYEGTPRLRGHLGHVFLYWGLGVFFILIPALVRWKLEGHIPWQLTVALVVIGIILLIVPILIVKRTRYRITNYRIDFERGWLSTSIDTIELWHVEHIKFQQSLFERMLDVGTVEVISHDPTIPNLFMRGIPHARQLFQTLEQRIIAVKRQQGVMKVDTGS